MLPFLLYFMIYNRKIPVLLVLRVCFRSLDVEVRNEQNCFLMRIEQERQHNCIYQIIKWFKEHFKFNIKKKKYFDQCLLLFFPQALTTGKSISIPHHAQIRARSAHMVT